jgi:hypothetical protein
MFGARMLYVGGETTNNHLHLIVVELLAGLPEATAHVIDLGLTAGFDFRRSFGFCEAVCAIPMSLAITRNPTFCISDAICAIPMHKMSLET